nr:hypothetical protein [Tanacetum cinerariifolium]
NLEPTHEEFMATVYPYVHGSLKLPVDEHVILEEPLSSSGALSSMKNLDDAYTFEDQFLNEKSTKDEPATTPTTSTLPLLPPPPQQSTSDSELAIRVVALEQRLAAFGKKSKTLDKTTQNIRSRVYHLELQDLPHKIDQTINTVVKEASGSYKLLPKHVALYEALEASMNRANMDEFLAKIDKPRKRRRDDQDPPPHLPGSDPSKRRRHDFGTSGSTQPSALQSSARKTSDT